MKLFSHLIKILAFCIICMFIQNAFGQSPYDAYVKANTQNEKGNGLEAYNTLKAAASTLYENSNHMTLEEAYAFFDLFERVSYGQGKMDEIDSLYSQAISYGQHINEEPLQCKYLLMKGNLLRIKNQWSEAIEVLKSALVFDCRQEDYIQIHAILGRCYNQINFDSSYYFTMTVLPLAEQQNDSTNLMLLYNNLVAFYIKSNRSAMAFEYEKKSLEYEGNYPTMQVGSNLSIAGLLTKMNNLSLADEYIAKAETIHSNKNNRRTEAQINYYKARVEFARKEYAKALEHIELAYQYFVERGYKNQIAAALSDRAIFAKKHNNLELYEESIKLLEEHVEKVKSISFKYAATSPIANYYIDKNQPARAKQLMDALDITLEEIDWNNRKNYLEIKAKIAKSEKNYLKSLEYYEQLNNYRDSIQRTIVSNQILLSEQQYDREKKNNEISSLTTEAAITKVRLNTSIWIIAFSLFSFGLLLFFFYKLKTKNKKISEQQKKLNTALQDKDILLREIHHRVKNNLQVVSSLLNLQSNYISDDAALEAINEGKNRVSSMALIHQNLYQEENLTGINCKEYFENLIDNLFDSYNIKEGTVSLKKEIGDLNLDVETMVPLGLIVNELISNALKHAFDTKNNGTILFHLGEDNNALILRVEDNGKGITPDEFLTSKSFGNKLIQAFKQKLGAEIDIENNNGTIFKLTISKYKLAA